MKISANIINKNINLSLNRDWLPVNVRTIGDAITDLCSSEMTGDNSCFALDIDYNLDDNGNPIFTSPKTIIPVAWRDWIKLPIRSWEYAVHSPKMIIRAPTVTVAVNYVKMPIKTFKGKPSKEAICARDGDTCQYTGVKLDKKNRSIDHVIPKSKGGKDTWENLVTTSKKLNLDKSDRSKEEMGLKLIKPPVAPRALKAFESIREAKHESWIPFLISKQN